MEMVGLLDHRGALSDHVHREYTHQSLDQDDGDTTQNQIGSWFGVCPSNAEAHMVDADAAKGAAPPVSTSIYSRSCKAVHHNIPRQAQTNTKPEQR